MNSSQESLLTKIDEELAAAQKMIGFVDTGIDGFQYLQWALGNIGAAKSLLLELLGKWDNI